MVYRQLVISPQEHAFQLSLSRTSDYRTGIDTSILCVNKEIYAEASSILYSENSPIIQPSMFPAPPELFREDNVKLTTRSLRSGPQYSVTDFSGRIYRHVLARFARVKITSWFFVNTSDDFIQSQWIMSNSFLQSVISELCHHKHEWRCPQKRELVISIRFFGKIDNPATWARRFQRFKARASWKISEETLEQVVRLEVMAPAGLLDSLKEIFKGEMDGLKVEWVCK